MRKVREVLRISWDLKLSRREAALSCGLARSTVGEYLRRADEAGLSWPLPEVDDVELEALLFPRVIKTVADRVVPDWTYVDKELRRKGVTRYLLWSEYKQANPLGYEYSRFCDHYRAWLGAQELSMRQVHAAGERMFVDYAGQTVSITNPESGVVSEAVIFVAVLGASSYAYCEATWSQTLEDWIASHVRTLNFFAGVPEIVVPDNLKAGVTRAHLYEPDLNPSYQYFAEYYGLSVIPARSRKPKDKAKAEGAVRLVSIWILAKLRDRKFFSLFELNDAIRELLSAYNNREFQKRPGTRRSLYEELDRPALRPLPLVPYKFAWWGKKRVHVDYHVTIEKHHYSVPHKFARTEVDVKIMAGTIEVFHAGKLVASHARSHRQGGQTTIKEHMPVAHREFADWTPERFLKWASKTGPKTTELVDQVMKQRTHPQQAFRACLGILRFTKSVGEQRLEAAATRAVALRSYSYKTVASILKNRLDEQPLEMPAATPLISHENIRGVDYYTSSELDESEK